MKTKKLAKTKVGEQHQSGRNGNNGNGHLDVGIIGFGVVGESTGKGLKTLGHEVYINDLKDLSPYAEEFHVLKPYDPSQTDLTLLILPTPTSPAPKLGGRINIRSLEQVALSLGEQIKEIPAFHLVTVRSTVPPGTTNYLAGRISEVSGKEPGRDFGIAMNPEFLRAFNSEYDFQHPRLTVVGVDDNQSSETMTALYRNIQSPIEVVTQSEAEAIKYAHNLRNAAKISFWNEVFLTARHLNYDYEGLKGEILARANYTKPVPSEDATGILTPKDQKFYAYLRHNGVVSPVSHEVFAAYQKTNSSNGVPPTQEDVVNFYAHVARGMDSVFWQEMDRAFKKIGGINTETVKNAVATTAEAYWNTSYGTYGGRAYGGTCLPKDTTAFESYMGERNVELPLLRAIINVNEHMEEIGPQDGESAKKYHSQRQHATYNNLKT
ncbi:MAG: hypothetical protein Q8Q31_02720 [Nanoarchaeota archaeon]|nr:hypothetical protein [Nanoarchaeota archaeon]